MHSQENDSARVPPPVWALHIVFVRQDLTVPEQDKVPSFAEYAAYHLSVSIRAKGLVFGCNAGHMAIAEGMDAKGMDAVELLHDVRWPASLRRVCCAISTSLACCAISASPA